MDEQKTLRKSFLTLLDKALRLEKEEDEASELQTHDD